MKKIIVLNSPLFESTDNKNQEDYLPPLGLGLIFSAIDKTENKVLFIDSLAENKGVKEIIELIQNEKPDIICINIFTTNYQKVKTIVEKSNNAIHWIIGGISTKSLSKEILQWDIENKIDIIYGDGEYIIKDTINSNIQQPPMRTHANKNFYIIDSKSAYYVKDLCHEHLDRNIFSSEPQINVYGEKEIAIYTSRGCPYNCAYCVAANSRNKEVGKVPHKNKEKIISDINQCLEKYPDITTIRILDDLFLSTPNSFTNAIHIFKHFSLYWRAMCHVKSIKNVNDHMVKELKESGCQELFIGIESGSPEILKRINKTNNIDLIKESVTRVLNVGINVKGYFICGFPHETKEDLEMTLQLASYLTSQSSSKSQFRNSTFKFRPYYGTELYDEIIQTKSLPYSSILYQIDVSHDMNDHIREKSFNFDAGNYSDVSDEELLSYLQKMEYLNGQNIQ